MSKSSGNDVMCLVENCPHKNLVQGFVKTWENHIDEQRQLSARLMSTQVTINTIARNAEYMKELTKLNQIADTLTNLDTKLVGAAIGRGQVPISIVLILALGWMLSFLIVLLQDTDLNVVVSDWLRLERSANQQQLK